MAVPTNTFLTFSAVGNREDLLDKITNISPTDTPFMSAIGRSTAKAKYHEWQTVSLAAAAGNAQLEGDDVTFGSPNVTVRVGNRTQISRKEVIVSGTQEAVDKAGRNSELVFQMSMKRAELKRDQEFILVGNQAPVTGNSSTATQLRPLCGWITTNDSRGSGGADGTASAAATDGTQRTFTEALLVTAMQSAWTQGGNPSLLMMGPKQRAVASTFTGGGTKFQQMDDTKLSVTISTYVGDFGTVKFVANRFMRGAQSNADREAFVLDPNLWALAQLRPFRAIDLAKTGDSEKGVVLTEYTLESLQEAGNAAVFDLT